MRPFSNVAKTCQIERGLGIGVLHAILSLAEIFGTEKVRISSEQKMRH